MISNIVLLGELCHNYSHMYAVNARCAIAYDTIYIGSSCVVHASTYVCHQIFPYPIIPWHMYVFYSGMISDYDVFCDFLHF